MIRSPSGPWLQGAPPGSPTGEPPAPGRRPDLAFWRVIANGVNLSSFNYSSSAAATSSLCGNSRGSGSALAQKWQLRPMRVENRAGLSRRTPRNPLPCLGACASLGRQARHAAASPAAPAAYLPGAPAAYLPAAPAAPGGGRALTGARVARAGARSAARPRAKAPRDERREVIPSGYSTRCRRLGGRGKFGNQVPFHWAASCPAAVPGRNSRRR